jgi:putative copper export protein
VRMSNAAIIHRAVRFASAALGITGWSALLGASALSQEVESTTLETLRPEHLLVAAFFLLGCLILIFEFVLFLRAGSGVSSSDVIRGFSVTLILIGVVALLGIGYNETQVQPAMALFGTMLGYLLGRSERREPLAGEHPATASSPQRPLKARVIRF